MPVVGRGNHHGIDVVPRGDLSEIGASRLLVQLRQIQGVAPVPGIDIADRHDLDALVVEEVLQIPRPHPADADARHRDPLAGRHLAALPEHAAGQDHRGGGRRCGAAEKLAAGGGGGSRRIHAPIIGNPRRLGN
ncbi:MAG: hypothetical protein R3F11_19240 [Verrucomicrobiales bacterium]